MSRWVYFVVVIVLVALGAPGCRQTPQFPEDGNVILVTVDTLRADFLSCYGHPKIETPIIDGLAAEGIRFSRAYAQSHITLPSHVSILTSLYPKDHGIIQNERPKSGPGIDPSISTLASIMKEAGFRTVAVTSNRILAPTHLGGLGRGFDTFHAPPTPEREAALTNRVFFRWLKQNSRDRFFAWIHYFDPHLPYLPPREYRSLYYASDPRDPRFTSMDRVVFPRAWVNPKSWAHRLIAWLEGIRDFRYAVSQYEGEISYVDTMIGQLLAKLREEGIDRKTLIVLTADHGESINEHEIYLGHFALYEPSTHVPLIVWAPTVFPRPRVVDALVMSVDIMPTVLDIVDIPATDTRLKGRSLLALLTGSTADGPHRHTYAEGNRRRQVMIRSRDWKYIKTLKPMRLTPRFGIQEGAGELYHLATDPWETANLVEREPRRVEEFERLLERWLGGEPHAMTVEPPRADPADYLKALGYVE